MVQCRAFLHLLVLDWSSFGSLPVPKSHFEFVGIVSTQTNQKNCHLLTLLKKFIYNIEMAEIKLHEY